MTKILSWLYLGGVNDAMDVDWMTKTGISSILNVARGIQDLKYPEGMDLLGIPIRDHPSEKISMELDIGYQYLDIARIMKRKVLVHCVAGISRSSTFVIYYLMKSQSISLSDAYQIVKSKRGMISPNSGFLKTLFQKEQELISNRLN